MTSSLSLFAMTLLIGSDMAITSVLDSADGPAKPEVINAWVSELDHADFNRRQHATRMLIAQGRPAIAQVTDMARTGTPEAVVRAIGILEQIYRLAHSHNDVATLDASELALESLAKENNRFVASRAGRALADNDSIREARAVVKIERLGGIVRYEDEVLPSGFFPADPNGVNSDDEPRRIAQVMLGPKWAGGDQGLRYIEHLRYRMTDPPTLYLIDGSKISPEAIQDLEGAMPRLRIESRGRACLGVGGGSLLENGCRIGRVLPGSAAEKGDLRENDVIVRFDGEETPDFASLVDLIADHDPGDRVDVEVRRSGDTVHLKITLDEWKP